MQSASIPYCNSQVGKDFLLLINFSKISTSFENDALSTEEQSQIITALNSYSHSALPQINAILPLIFQKTASSGLRNLLPPETLKILRDRTFRLLAKELAQRQVLINIINLFKKNNIPIILLKGAAFAGSLYPVNTPRLGVDTDLLVTTKQFHQACMLLSESMSPVLLDSKRIATHETLFERIFTPKGKTTPIVELHRELTNPYIFAIDYEQLWQRSRVHPLYHSGLVRILSPEDTLLHLAMHACRDLNFCTHNVLDAHEVWCQWKPDEKILFEAATQWGAKKVLYCLLMNSKAITETPISNDYLKALKPSAIIDLTIRQLLSSPSILSLKEPSLTSRLSQLWSQLTFPDSITRGMFFQLSYALVRIRDLIRSINKG